MSRRVIVSLLLLTSACLLGHPPARAGTVDPAVVGERLVRLEAMLESIEVTLASQKRQLDELANSVQKLREEALQQGNRRPWNDDMKRLSDAIQEVDRKRIADSEQVVKVLGDLRKAVAAGDTAKPSRPSSPSRGGSTPSGSAAGAPPKAGTPTAEKAVPYVFQEGDVLSRVVEGFNEQAKKEGYETLTTDQVMKFNAIKDARRIPVGATIQLPMYKK